jgi:hypothetical protein
MPAAKRKRGARGPARGTGGRPVLPEAERATNLTVRLNGSHRAMLARLRLLWGLDNDTEAMRRALEMASDMVREG